MHELDAVQAGIAHVGKDLGKHGRELIARLRGRINPRVSAYDHLARGRFVGRRAGGEAKAGRGGSARGQEKLATRERRGGQ